MQALLNNISQYITMSIKNLLGEYDTCRHFLTRQQKVTRSEPTIIAISASPALMARKPKRRKVSDEQQARSREREMFSAGNPARRVACLAGTSVSRASSARTQLP